ncbi:tripartite tricarboxylate transporter substrate binding protein [Streptomyces sp. NPDC001027]|uniref:tripartite tricarboxylate transporter substrate binding protein n=1 Tax=Streptomyces sp. NPDC001027 TaxID=3154771 RepID=UPI0033226387
MSNVDSKIKAARSTRIARWAGAACAGGMIVAVTSCAQTHGGAAENYPTRSVKWIVPFGAGGSTDLAARAFAPCMEEELGEPMVLENQDGGGGVVGTSKFVQAKDDGYTLAFVPSSPVALAPLTVRDVTYTADDIEPVGRVLYSPYVLAVSPDSPYEDAEDFFAAAKKAKKPLTVATVGESSLPGIMLKQLDKKYGIPTQQVPVQSATDMARGVISGDWDASYATLDPGSLAQVKKGDLRVLAVGANEQLSYLPDVPLFDDLGYEDLLPSVGSDFYLAARAGTPADILDKLEAATKKCVSDPDVVARVGKEWVPKEQVDRKELTRQLNELVSGLEEITK